MEFPGRLMHVRLWLRMMRVHLLVIGVFGVLNRGGGGAERLVRGQICLLFWVFPFGNKLFRTFLQTEK